MSDKTGAPNWIQSAASGNPTEGAVELQLSQAFGTAAASEAYGTLVYTFCHRLVGTVHTGEVRKEVFVGAWRDRPASTRL